MFYPLLEHSVFCFRRILPTCLSFNSVTSTVESIQGTIDGSPTVNRVLADLNDVPGSGKNSYKGVEIADNNNLRTRFNSVRGRYMNQLINNLHDRFPEDDLELLECFDIILNPQKNGLLM